jgi:hypothetical protein
MDHDEPSLPPLPIQPTHHRPQRPSLLTRKRTHSSYAHDLADNAPSSAVSSDPALFSSDDATPDVENYTPTGKRKKKMYTGSWWNHHMRAKKGDRKREFRRNLDSGIFMGSEGDTDGDSLPSSDSLGSLEEMFLKDQAANEDDAKTRQQLLFLDQMGQNKTDRELNAKRVIRTFASEKNGIHAAKQDVTLPGHYAARAVIQYKIDDGNEEISLQDLRLSSLPDDILELNTLTKAPNLVPGMLDTGRRFEPRLQMFLANNAFTKMPLQLLELENIRHLSLRNNQLVTIPSGIRKMTRLEHLNVSGNQLTFLPYEIVELQADCKLRELVAVPNPWAEPPHRKNTILIEMSKPNGMIPIRKWVQEKATKSESADWTALPSLRETVLRQLATFAPKDDLRSIMPQYTPHAVLEDLGCLRESLDDGGWQCAHCRRTLVLSWASWLEGICVGGIAQPLPFMRRVCSAACYEQAYSFVDGSESDKAPSDNIR